VGSAEGDNLQALHWRATAARTDAPVLMSQRAMSRVVEASPVEGVGSAA